MDAADPRDPENGSGPEPRPEEPAEGSPTDAGAAGEAGGAGGAPEPAEPDVDHAPGEAGEAPAAPGGGAETVEQPRFGDTPSGAGTEPVDPWSGSAETIFGGVDPVPPGETGPTGTGVLPVVPAGTPQPPETPGTPRWSARAQVPTPGARDSEYETQGWAGPERPPRSVMPALIALAIVLLLAIIGFGLWLGLHNKNAPTTPITTPPAQVTTTSPTNPPTTPPTTAPPTTAPPTTPALIPVPNVVGDDLATAQAKLTQAGLKVGTQTNKSSDTVPAGHVISSDPNTGFPLQAGASVNLVVSTGPAVTATPTPTSS